MYSNICSRAGLVALVFVLIDISLVSAVPLPNPIPAPQSGLSSTLFSRSNPIHDGNNHIQLDIGEMLSKGQMSRAPAAMRALTRNDNLIDTDDDQLVRRTSIFTKIKRGFQDLGHDIKHVAQKIGSGIKKVAQEIGSGIKKVAEKVGTGIKKAAEKVGAGVETAAKKVWNFAKTTGAKVAKFGLKVVESVGEVVAKAASFIPDVGKPIEKAIDGISKAAGVISDHIHVKLSAKLQKGMNVMNAADKVMSYFRRDLEKEGFQQRDIGHVYHFEEDGSNDILLEHLVDQEGSLFDDDFEHYFNLHSDVYPFRVVTESQLYSS